MHRIVVVELKHRLKIPMAHDPGDPHGDPILAIMRNYRSGGTPWTVIIDPAGMVVYNDFHIQVAQALSLIENLIKQSIETGVDTIRSQTGTV